MMRKLKYMFLLVTVIISGCWDRIEINDLAFVMGTALDLTDDGNFFCTLQVAKPVSTEGGSGGGDGHQGSFYLITAEGKNGNDILLSLQKKSSRRLFFSHRSVVFISERLAKYGIRDALDVFIHDPRNRLKTYLMVVKGGEAREILQLNYPLKQVPIEAVKQMQGSGDDLAVTLRDFFISMQSEGIEPVVGVVELDNNPKDPHEQTFRIAGTGVFKSLKLTGFLNEKETVGLMWLTNKLKYSRITTTLPQGHGEIGMILNYAERKIVTQVEHDSVYFNIFLEGQGGLVENNTSLDINEPDHLKQIQSALEEEVKKQVQGLLDKIQKKYKVDSVGFGQEINKSNPNKWAMLKDQWGTRFPKATIQINVNLSINGAGMVHSTFEIRK
ncbi:Ger(x)C family spore germination protein [Paenibacillus solanacearum]|nr:Ger(x)C family spore germination protein [Paenibacillus solanacearum]